EPNCPDRRLRRAALRRRRERCRRGHDDPLEERSCHAHRRPQPVAHAHDRARGRGARRADEDATDEHRDVRRRLDAAGVARQLRQPRRVTTRADHVLADLGQTAERGDPRAGVADAERVARRRHARAAAQASSRGAQARRELVAGHCAERLRHPRHADLDRAREHQGRQGLGLRPVDRRRGRV
ncbi:MAG: hypothetical protein AVDCRST_MAG67-1631, partial [uncultured Solirubrobacteraceae bacterium]